jgi:hypothetical protein
MLGTFKHTGWRYSSRQLCNCVIGGVDVAHRIRMLARRSSDHHAVRLLIVLTSPHSYRSPVDRVTCLSAPAPAKRAGAQRLCALAHSGRYCAVSECPLVGALRKLGRWVTRCASQHRLCTRPHLFRPMVLLRDRRSGSIEPCLPTSAKVPPTGAGWIHEIKHDGFRLLARRDGAGVRLITRHGNDFTSRFPLIATAIAAPSGTHPDYQIDHLRPAIC